MVRAWKVVYLDGAAAGADRIDLAASNDVAVAAATDPERAGEVGGQGGEVAGAIALEREDGAVEAEGPLAGHALDHGVVGEIGADRAGDAGFGGDEAEGGDGFGIGRVAAAVAPADDPAAPAARGLGIHAGDAGVEQREAAHA